MSFVAVLSMAWVFSRALLKPYPHPHPQQQPHHHDASLGGKGYVCEIGSVPDSWDYTHLQGDINGFLALHNERKTAFGTSVNQGGNGLFHSFIIYAVLKRVRPDLVVESGVFNGETSWLIRKVTAEWSPKFVRIDPSERGWTDDSKDRSKVFDFRGAKFVDFAEIEWDAIQANRSQALVLFDDHMDQVRRLAEAARLGFGHALYDDNYIAGVGDAFSLKNACDGYPEDSSPSRYRHLREERGDGRMVVGTGQVRQAFAVAQNGMPRICDNFHNDCKIASSSDLKRKIQELLSLAEVYWEGPPLTTPTRPFAKIKPYLIVGVEDGPNKYEGPGGTFYSHIHDSMSKESIKSPVFDSAETAVKTLGITREELDFEETRYLNMAYVKIRNNAVAEYKY